MSEQESQVIEEAPEVEEPQQLDEATPAEPVETAETKDEPEDLRKVIAEKEKVIAEKAFKEREARRRADSLDKRLKELEAKQNPEFDGVIPPKPDPFDDDYDKKIQAREDALQRKARADLMSIQQKEAEAEAQRKREREEYEKQQKQQADFRRNAAELGVDQEVLSKSAQTVISYGVTPDIEDALMSDKDGPLMLNYLAANPLELADLIEASPLRAGMLLADVKSKSLKLKPKPSSAPPPAQTVEGRGAPKRERGPKGATFE